MHLSVGLPLRDLANRFYIHRTTVSRIIAIWTHFLCHLFGSIRLWLPAEEVKAHIPPEFSSFTDTQVVLDCTEIFCQTPSSLLLQSESTYKSNTTFKAMIGIAPHGPIPFVSALYERQGDIQAIRHYQTPHSTHGYYGRQGLSCGHPRSLQGLPTGLSFYTSFYL